MTRQVVIEPGPALESAVRLASRSEMLASLHTQAAHDFRDSLNSMTINVELLARTLPEGLSEDGDRAVQQRCINSLRREFKRMAETSGRALEESRPERTGVQRVALTWVVDAVVGIVRRAAERQGVRVSIVPPVRPLEVMGEPDQLRLALFNVACNALEAMPGGGELTFSLTADAAEGVVAVSDTGAGIADEVYPRVWDLFFTTKPEGLGLGLAVVKTVAAAHGGTVVLDRDATGVTFRMRLPLVP